MAIKLRLINDESKRGVYLTEIDFITMIKICHVRNIKLYNKFVEHYEFIFEKKFDIELIK